MKLNLPTTKNLTARLLAAASSIAAAQADRLLYDNIPDPLPSFTDDQCLMLVHPSIPDDQPYRAQPFITGDLGIVSAVSVYIINGGVASGALKVTLMDDDAGLPGQVIAEFGEIVLDPLPVWDKTNTIGELVTLYAQVAGLSPDTRYYIGFDISNMSDPGGNFPSASYFNLQSPEDEGTHGAEPALVRPTGVWEPLSDYVVGANYTLLRISEPDAAGFLGHEVTFSGRYYDFNNQAPPLAPIVLGSARVDSEVEFVGRTIDLGGGVVFSAATFDLAADTIDVDMAHLAGNTTDPGNINGYVIEDKNGTVPDFLSVTVDTTASTLIPDNVHVSPNTIWMDIRGITIPPDAFIRLNVTFAEASSALHLSLNPSPDGSMILEGPAQIGGRYRFERSEDLINFTPIDNELTAESPFVMTFVKPTEPTTYYRLRRLD